MGFPMSNGTRDQTNLKKYKDIFNAINRWAFPLPWTILTLLWQSLLRHPFLPPRFFSFFNFTFRIISLPLIRFQPHEICLKHY